MTITSNYSWFHKELNIDMSQLCEKIDEKAYMRNYLSNLYKDQMELIKALPDLNDGIDVIFRDKYYFDETENNDYYLGEWNDVVRHGRGYYHFGNGEYYIGQFKNNEFDGKGCYYWRDGKKLDITFKKGKKDGIGLQILKNGSKLTCEYKNNEFIK